MKRGIIILCIFGTGLFCLAAAPREGPLRALQGRTERVVKMKNDFVARALAAHGVAYEGDAAGNVVRIEAGGRWHAVKQIEVIPLATGASGPAGEVTGHEIVFTTAEGVFSLTSDLRIP